MRVLVNFMHRDIWWVHCLAEDARTPVSPFVSVPDDATLVKLLRYVGADDPTIDEVKADIRRWSRGSVWINLAQGRKNLLRVFNA